MIGSFSNEFPSRVFISVIWYVPWSRLSKKTSPFSSVCRIVDSPSFNSLLKFGCIFDVGIIACFINFISNSTPAIGVFPSASYFFRFIRHRSSSSYHAFALSYVSLKSASFVVAIPTGSVSTTYSAGASTSVIWRYPPIGITIFPSYLKKSSLWLFVSRWLLSINTWPCSSDFKYHVFIRSFSSGPSESKYCILNTAPTTGFPLTSSFSISSFPSQKMGSFTKGISKVLPSSSGIVTDWDFIS